MIRRRAATPSSGSPTTSDEPDQSAASPYAIADAPVGLPSDWLPVLQQLIDAAAELGSHPSVRLTTAGVRVAVPRDEDAPKYVAVFAREGAPVGEGEDFLFPVLHDRSGRPIAITPLVATNDAVTLSDGHARDLERLAGQAVSVCVERIEAASPPTAKAAARGSKRVGSIGRASQRSRFRGL